MILPLSQIREDRREPFSPDFREFGSLRELGRENAETPTSAHACARPYARVRA